MLINTKPTSIIKCVLALPIITFGLSGYSYAESEYEYESKSKRNLPGYVAHGINVYNNEPLFDYSQVSPTVPWLLPNANVIEVGEFVEGAQTAAPITSATDRESVIATTRVPFDFFNPEGNVDELLFNRTLDTIGTNFLGFAELQQRVPMIPFEEASAGDIYRTNKTNSRPTVADWETASGQMRVVCRSNGTANAKVTMRDAFPNAVYTLWDVGVHDPLTFQERGYVAPFGGLPNIVLTDNKGCGFKEIKLAFCPQACDANVASCTSYVSAFYHWDNQVYGGSPSATFAGMPAGVVAANHVVWPFSGTALIEPQNRFHPKRTGCPK